MSLAGMQVSEEEAREIFDTVGPGRNCSPRHRMPLNQETRVIIIWMTCGAMSLADTARHVVGCHVTQETWARM